MSERAYLFQINYDQSESFNFSHLQEDLRNWLIEKCAYSNLEGIVGMIVIDDYYLNLLKQAIKDKGIKNTKEVEDFIETVKRDIGKSRYGDVAHYIVY
jgi:hypothetical protein